MPAHSSSVLSGAQALVADFLDDTASSTHQRLAAAGPVAGVAVTTRVPHRGERTAGASTDLAADVDRIQFEVGTGPCLDTLRTGEALHVRDLRADQRWGAYGVRAAERGAACCTSVPVMVEGETVAVFKVYGPEPDSLTQAQCGIAGAVGLEIAGGFALATHLTRLATELDDLTAMVTHRRVIDLGLGITMERGGVDAATAFEMLRRQSQRHNTKLHEVAADVVGSVPGATAADLVAPYSPRG